jgi:hypothetical protein
MTLTTIPIANPMTAPMTMIVPGLMLEPSG